MAPLSTVFLILGEMVSQLQAKVLRKKRFISILGAEAVHFWGFGWDMLKDPAILFADVRRISATSILHTNLQDFTHKWYDKELDDLLSQFLKLRQPYTKKP